MLTILEDTRQQVHKHDVENVQLESLGVKIFRSKLPVGDYALMTNLSVVVDSKKDIQESIGNICGKQHVRFREECIKAQNNEIQLIVLIENEDGVACIEDVRNWANPRIRMQKWITLPDKSKRKVLKYPRATTGEVFAKCLTTMQEKYGVRFEFCNRDAAGRRILELLGVAI